MSVHLTSRSVRSLVPVAVALSMLACKDSPPPDDNAAANTPEKAPEPAAVSAHYPEPLSFAIPIEVNGKTIVVSEKGEILVSAENDYEALSPADWRNTLWARKNGLWQLIDKNGKEVLHPEISPFIDKLTPGYFSFREGKLYGIIDAAGNIVHTAQYDAIYASGEDACITYEIDGKRGIMDAHGKIVTEALYDTSDVASNLQKRNGLIPAERDGENWIIDTKSGEQKQVGYIDIGDFSEGFAVVIADMSLNKRGLINEKGDLTIPAEYNWIDKPSQGLAAFRESDDSPCGYMDMYGKVIIRPMFAACLPFGETAAFVHERKDDGSSGKYILIGRDGKRIDQTPEYDDAAETSTAWLGDSPSGFISVARIVDENWTMAFGIFDTHQGIEIIAPDTKYSQLSAITPKLFLYSSPDAPEFSDTLASIGIVDADGKEILKPGDYGKIALTWDKQYLLATAHGAEALFDMSGKELIGPKWVKLEVDKRLNVIFAYSLAADSETFLLRAIYALNGRPILSVRKTQCGAEELSYGAGKLVWPEDSKAFCPDGFKPEAQHADAE
ncbi:MAG: WG repeat-containing protein [Azoarcus sp.]|nr:WG repeat-containing protein [Azoarcus sp.]